MPMPLYLTRLSLSNFRGFKNATASLAPLKFIVGSNSGGKSSLCAAISSVAQSEISWRSPFRNTYRPTATCHQRLGHITKLQHEHDP